ncbi:MAG: hypothetical protein PHH09_11150, partial [Methanoregulaceae archaeon]|nr:hypothetical protein [Methanoregulaceae archaeon]
KKNKKFIRGKTLALVAKVGKKNPVPVRVIIFLRYSTGEYIFYIGIFPYRFFPQGCRCDL